MNAVRPIQTKWNVAEQDHARVREFSEALELPPIVAHLLLLRGLDSVDRVRDFLRPRMAHLSDPFLLTDMDKAVARIAQARKHAERILIFGDYDVDGISATVILLNGLQRFGLENIDYAMPRRLTEGYGLNPERVEQAATDGVGLLITVDNGIAAHAAAERARELGIDLIVTDHHALETTLPQALAVINPKREPPAYPGADLCGAGVALKLAAALNGTANDLDIAALGTVADIVPLLDENRVIVALGLRHMAKYERTGIAKLAAAAGVDLRSVSSEHIGFQLGPRINAAGRLDDAMLGLRLLLEESPGEARRMAQLLNEANEARRAIERQIYQEAVEELEAYFVPDHRAIVLARRGWHAGVIGIVASRIENRYHRPVIMVAIDEEGVGRGSARAGRDFDMMGALSGCAELMEKFGGHRSAAGLTIRETNIPALREAFAAAAREQLGDGELTAELDIDVLASFTEIDSKLLKSLELLEPVGHGNPAPTFCSLGVEVMPRSMRILKDRHLRMAVRQTDRVFTAIGFNMAERFYTEDLSGQIDIAYTPQFNVYRGETTIQLVLKDIRPC